MLSLLDVNGYHNCPKYSDNYLENLNDCILTAGHSDDVNPDQTAYSPCLHRYRVPTLFEKSRLPCTISSQILYGKHSSSIFFL